MMHKYKYTIVHTHERRANVCCFWVFVCTTWNDRLSLCSIFDPKFSILNQNIPFYVVMTVRVFRSKCINHPKLKKLQSIWFNYKKFGKIKLTNATSEANIRPCLPSISFFVPFALSVYLFCQFDFFFVHFRCICMDKTRVLFFIIFIIVCKKIGLISHGVSTDDVEWEI